MSDKASRHHERAAHADPDGRRAHWHESLRQAPDDVAPLLPSLELSVWSQLSSEDQRDLAALLEGVLKSRSRPLEFVDVSGFGPEGSQAIARFRDASTELLFALIPGGRFTPGLSEEQFDLLASFGELHETRSQLPQRVDEVRLDAFLMGVSPVPSGFRGLPPSMYEGPEADRLPTFQPSSLGAGDLDGALELVGGRLPSAPELEWAAKGGLDLLFPWGNDLDFYDQACADGQWRRPEVRTEFPHDPSDTRSWPFVNAFGLLGLGGVSTWCDSTSGGFAPGEAQAGPGPGKAVGSGSALRAR